MRRKRAQPKLRTYAFSIIVIVGLFGGVAAFMEGAGVNRASQVAMGAAANRMCESTSKDVKCPCDKGIDPKTGKCGNVKGGGKQNCKCKDPGSPTEGYCATVGPPGSGKCLATSIDGKAPMLPMGMMPMMGGMPPMLPMIPMGGGGGGDMPMMQQPCTPKTDTTAGSSSSSTPNGAVVTRPPDCVDAWGGGGGGGFSFPMFGANAYNPDTGGTGGTGGTWGDGGDSGGVGAAIWNSLLESLGISSGGSNTSSGGGTNTGGTGPSGSNASQLQSGSTTGTNPYTAVTDGFGFVTGSTFSYSVDMNPEEVNSILDRIIRTLRALLAVVSAWL